MGAKEINTLLHPAYAARWRTFVQLLLLLTSKECLLDWKLFMVGEFGIENKVSNAEDGAR